MPLLTLGQADTAKVRLIVWCKACQHRFEPDTEELAEQHGAETTVLRWASRLLRCSQCGARDADYVVSGTKRQELICGGNSNCVGQHLASISARAHPVSSANGT